MVGFASLSARLNPPLRNLAALPPREYHAAGADDHLEFFQRQLARVDAELGPRRRGDHEFGTADGLLKTLATFA